ncbi:NO-inducible flavohemoprotein [Halalkalibacillus sediminis]|uniref:Flavohemoprotein n=1 Tax=Halalkalibacillus sediminis TaxID=2018042 RepID=A0A2I0QWB0_9BACI|nr:NO-inducible flavohemoprotein [Halalkalibacillus sediminis]PKR78390.1 NO-inducible flavohemoprotein [Halalkalibacillus sediminis]
MTTTITSGLDERTRDIIKSTVPVLAEHGEAITTHFYKRMFADHPELKNIFNMVHQKEGKQPRALANAVYAAAKHIDDLTVIAPAAEKIAEKHVSLNIKAEHYPIVGKYLLIAIEEVLGDAVTDEVIDAWGAAYQEIADLFIKIEKEKYDHSPWNDFINFSIAGKVKESEEITSFYLKPVDHRALPSFKPGQYLTIKAEIPGEKYTHLRQYSLSDAPNENHFRISVKKESGRGELPAGIVSSWLHDQVQEGDIIPVSAPAGDFYLDTEKDCPIVLLSGGVGLTPLLSMKKTAEKLHPGRKIYFIHAARNGSVHALKDEMNGENTFIVYEKPSDEDQAYDRKGIVDLEWLKTVVPKEADFYFCGPEGFMRAINTSLKDWGVPGERINYEFFGPQGNLD